MLCYIYITIYNVNIVLNENLGLTCLVYVEPFDDSF